MFASSGKSVMNLLATATWKEWPCRCRIRRRLDEARSLGSCCFSSKLLHQQQDHQIYLPDPALVDTRHAPAGFDPSSAVVYRDFVTPQEAKILAEDLLSRMKR
jgi:hypothetical protein